MVYICNSFNKSTQRFVAQYPVLTTAPSLSHLAPWADMLNLILIDFSKMDIFTQCKSNLKDCK